LKQGLERGLGAVSGCEIAQEGITGAEGKKSKRDSGVCASLRENAVEDFVCGAVAAHGDETAIALIVGLTSERCDVARACRGNDVDVKAASPQPGDCRTRQLGGAASARCGIDYGEERFSHEMSGLLPLTVYRKS
jgi:hypothetical protein